MQKPSRGDADFDYSSFKNAHREVALVVQKVINDRLAA